MGKRSVLVIDDDDDVREALHYFLADEGVEAAEARDGSSALEYLRRAPKPCLILLDWNMAPMNASDFMVAKTGDPELAPIPVVLLTADVRIQEKQKTSTFVASLRKPIDLDLLHELIQQHCHV